MLVFKLYENFWSKAKFFIYYKTHWHFYKKNKSKKSQFLSKWKFKINTTNYLLNKSLWHNVFSFINLYQYYKLNLNIGSAKIT